MANDADYNRLIHRTEWLRLRRSILTAHPLCVKCKEEGRVTAATEVHHIQPVEEAWGYANKKALMYNPANLMALCHACHVEVHKAMRKGTKEANKERNKKKFKQLAQKFFGEEG